VLCDDIPKRRYLANLPRVFKGTHVNEPGMHLLRGREISFEADRPFTAYADGDPIAELPVTVRVLERTLRVLAP
jgi:diacylglycerol kinase family enzyme